MRVIDEASGKPIAGATIRSVCLGEHSGVYITDTSGRAAVIAIGTPGDARGGAFTVFASGYSNAWCFVTSDTPRVLLSKVQP